MRKSLLALMTMLLAAPVFGHGPQIQITNENNKIVTRQLFLDGLYNTFDGTNYNPSAPASVYVIPLAPQFAFNGTGYWSQPNSAFPLSGSGIAWTYGWTHDGTTAHTTFPTGANVRFVQSLVGDLQVWNGSAFAVDTGNPNRPQLELFKGSTAIVSGPGTVNSGTALPALAAPASPSDAQRLDDHTGIRYQLLGDGVIPSASHNTAPVADGIYLSQLQLSLANQPNGFNIADSDPFYYVFYKGVSQSSAFAAAQFQFPGASIQVVPEPISLTLLALSGVLLGARRRTLALNFGE